MSKAIRLKISPDSNITTLDIDRTIRISQLSNDIAGTLIDPEILREGTHIHLPRELETKDIYNRKISYLHVPPVSPDGRVEQSGELMFLHPFTLAANRVLAYFEQSEGNIEEHVLQRLIDLYYLTLVKKVAGHRGIISTNIGGTRMSNSARLVLLPHIDDHPDTIHVNANALKKADIEEGSLVLLFRDPVIWTGSVDVVKVKAIPDDVIRMHVSLFTQFGADCDGDQMAIVGLPNATAEVIDELKSNLIKHTRENFVWPKSLCPDDLPEKPDWDNIIQDTQRRFTVTGLSYGPADVRSWKDRPPKAVKALEDITGKEGKGLENQIISRNPEVAREIMLSVNYANLFMKGYLGIVGETARRLMVIMGSDEWVSKAVNNVSQIIQQSTLDAKHKVVQKSRETKKKTGPIEIMELFERKGTWKNKPINECIETLVNADVPEEDATRVILYFRVVLPILTFSEINLEETDDIRMMILDCLTDQDGSLRTNFSLNNVIDTLASKLSERDGVYVDPSDVIDEIKDFYMVGLSSMIEKFYPSFLLAHKSTSKDIQKAVECYKRVFHNDNKDRGSLFKVISREEQ